MSERDLPDAGTADGDLTFFEGVEALEGILDGPQAEPEKNKVQNTADDDEGEANAEPDEVEAEMSDESDDDEGSEADDEDDDSEADDESAEALELSDEMEIDLGDGRKATFAELKDHYGQVQKRVADFQRDYTRKTDALAQDRQEVETQSQRVMQWAEQIKQQRDLVLAYQQQFMPQPPSPDMMDDDPVGYMRKEAEYKQAMGQLQQLQAHIAHEQQQRSAMEMQEQEQQLEAEKARMLESIPEFSKPEKFEAFRRDLVEVFAPAYGFTADEIGTVRDHRFAKVMRDAIAYNKLKAKQPEAKARVSDKPPVIRSGQSMSQKGKAARDRKARLDALRKTGSLEAGINALMDLDL